MQDEGYWTLRVGLAVLGKPALQVIRVRVVEVAEARERRTVV